MTILFLIVVNFLTSTEHLWALYPAFSLLISAVGIYCIYKKKYLLLSFLCSLLTLLFLIIMNVLNTPEYPWVLYTIAPIILWPILVSVGKYAGTLLIALLGSTGIILYYLILNLFLAPGYPWVIFPAFVVLWWPLVIYHVKRKTYFNFSLQASLFISLFFILLNIISTPDTIWAVYPIFAVIWWPLSMYYFVHKRKIDS